MIREIIKSDNDILYKECSPVSFPLTESDKEVMKDLVDTFVGTPKAIGLAAPQIAKSICLFVYNMYNKNDMSTCMIMFNPKIIKTYGKKHKGVEACLSYPDKAYVVHAYEMVKVEYYDDKGNKHVLKLRGYEARVFQHEYRHLTGQPWPKDAIMISREEAQLLKYR